MFLKMRKSKGPDKSKSVEDSDTPETAPLGEKVAQEKDVLADQTANLEGSVNNKTGELEGTGQQLDELTNTGDSVEAGEEEIQIKKPVPQILEVDDEQDLLPEEVIPVNEVPRGETNLNTLLEKDETEDTAAADDGEADVFSDIFSEEEEETSPLANLIAWLPSVAAEELIADMQQIKDIIKEKATRSK